MPEVVGEGLLDASSAQRTMWFDRQLDAGSVRFHVSTAVRVRAEGDAALFRQVLQRIIDTTPSLRTRFVEVDGEPFRRVDEQSDVDLTVLDASTWSTEQVDDRLRHEHLRPFDLEHGPLARFVVLSRSSSDHVLAIVLHHSVTDLWSNAVLWYLVAAVYRALDRGEPVPGLEHRGCYTDFVDEQLALVTSQKAVETLDHWRPIFDRWVPQDLFTDRSVGDTLTGVGGVHTIELDDELVSGLGQWARDRGATLRAAVLAAFQVVLHLGHDLETVFVGEVKANRSVRDARSIGCFMNPVTRSASFEPHATLGSVVDEVHQSSLTSRPYERYPFERLLHELRPGHGAVPFFAASFSWQKAARVAPDDLAGSLALGERGRSAEVEGFEIQPYTMPVRSSPLPLSLLAAASGERVGLALEYQAERFAPASIERLSRHLVRVLRTMVETPDAPVAEVDLVSEPEREEWRREWDAVRRPLDPTLTAHAMFERQAVLTPTDVAVRDIHGAYTYADLDLRANRLAHHLADLGVAEGDLVGICLDRTVDMIVAMIAVWKCGAGYVPMDPSFPRRRLDVMVEDAATGVIVTRSAVLAGLGEDVDGRHGPFGSVRVLDLDRDAETIAAAPGTAPAVTVSGGDLAYVIFTSGSTGRPKGVEVEHRNVVNFLMSMASRPGLDASDVVLAATTLSFDISVLELVLPLTVGAEVLLVERDLAVDPQRLADAMRHVTVAQATPTTWRMLIDAGWAGRQDLTILCGGEPLGPRLARELLGRCDTLWNLYGPTETTVWSAAARLEGNNLIPLGVPVDNTRLYVLDGERLVPDGTAGELWIGGAGVARGYVGRPDLTSERFVDDPFQGSGERMYRTGDLVRRGPDGGLEFLGRVDDQVKLRGHRIELGEVESALETHRAVLGAVAAVRDFGPGDERLVAYVVASEASGFDEAIITSMREHLRERLPEYMIPAVFVPLDHIPRTPNDKVDRNALPDPRSPGGAPGSTGVRTTGPASGDLVETVVGIYREVLGDDRIGPQDDFFELGGHSILATRLASRLRHRLLREVPLRAVFDNPTPAALAAVVGAAPGAPMPSPDNGMQGADPTSHDGAVFELSHSQERMWFMQHLHPEASAYNLAAALRVRGEVDRKALRWALDELVRRHTALRTVFFEDGGVPRLRVMEPYSPELEVRDLVGGGLAVDGSELVQDALHSLARVPFDLSTLPLFRLQAYRVGDDEHVLGLAMHHIIADQWSFGVLARELTSYYEEYRAGRDVPRSPTEATRPELYSRRERRRIAGPSTEASLAYWRRQLADVPVIEIPPDRPRPATPSMAGRTLAVAIPDELASAVSAAAREQSASEFMVLLAAFQVLVHRLTGETDIPVGVPTANRHWLESESLISSLVNTLVIRTDLSGAGNFGEVVRRVREVSLDAFEHQDVPFERLVRELVPARDLSRSPLFQLFFNVQNAPFELPSVEGLEFEVLRPDRRAAQFDFSLTVDTAVTNTVTLEYATDLYDEAHMQRLLEDYLDVLRQGVDDERVPLGPVVGAMPLASTSPPAMSASPGTPGGTADDSQHVWPIEVVERQLAEIWADVLGVAEVGHHDNFFDLGGHSLLAVRIMAEVHRVTGRRPPITALFQAPTVAELAALLRSEGWLTRWTSLIEVQRGADMTPLFYVSPYLISALSFHGLGDVLGDDVPFYVLQPQGMESDDPVHHRVEDMAAHYLRELKTVQPHGPYRIGGHCAGGWVAFEMARQLQEAGERVDKLIVVDVEPPGIGPPRRKWLQYVVSRAVLYGGSGRLLDAARWQFDLWRERLRARWTDGLDDTRMREVRTVHREAHRVYRGGQIDGGLAFVRSEEWALLPDKAWHLDWQQLVSGRIDLRQVSGAHSALLHGANVEELGTVITSVIGVR